MHQQRLHGVAGGAVLRLGVHANLDRLLQVRVLVDVHGTNPIGVAKDWNPRGILDGLHELVGAPWDHEVNVLVLRKELCHGSSAIHTLDAVSRQADFRECSSHSGDQRFIGLLGLLAALQEERIARLHGQSCNLHTGIWPGFVDDEQNADGAGHPIQVQTFRHLVGVGDLPNRVRQLDDVVDASQQRVKLGTGNIKTLEE
mmetsp:Transcript_15354/g.24491  ORF Transcript_15354/g.24491 Transcript_15354/m.24491 type:complete len:200 (-) Transcript_15354:268-867(-)